MKGGSLGVKASCDEKSKHWLLARCWYLREGAGGAGTAGTWQMAFCRLHLVCQEAGKWWALGCAALLPHCPHHPLKIGAVVSLFVWFSGICCWDCDPSIASQGEITLKIKNAENSQVACNLVQFGKGEQSPEVSRLEGRCSRVGCLPFLWASSDFWGFLFHFLLQYLLLVFNDYTCITTKLHGTCLDSVYWNYVNPESIT